MKDESRTGDAILAMKSMRGYFSRKKKAHTLTSIRFSLTRQEAAQRRCIGKLPSTPWASSKALIFEFRSWQHGYVLSHIPITTLLLTITCPQNYPWQLALCPLVGAISAGCTAIIKGSEHSPASSALMADLLPKYLDPEGYAVVLGEVEQAQALLKKPWGHSKCYLQKDDNGWRGRLMCFSSLYRIGECGQDRGWSCR